MTRLTRAILLIFLLIFSGCSTLPKVNLNNSKRAKITVAPKVDIDFTLPEIDSLSVRFISELSTIAFEWPMVRSYKIKGYVIYRTDFNAKYPLRLKPIEERYATHFVDTGLKPGTTYLYQFATLGTNGKESKKSAIKTITTSNILAPVTFVHATSNLPRQVKIIWRPHTEKIINRYLIYRNTQNKWQK